MENGPFTIDNDIYTYGIGDIVYLNKHPVTCYFNQYDIDDCLGNYPVIFDVDSIIPALHTQAIKNISAGAGIHCASMTKLILPTVLSTNIVDVNKHYKIRVTPKQFKDWFKYHVIPMYESDTNFNTINKSPYSISKIYKKLRTK